MYGLVFRIIFFKGHFNALCKAYCLLGHFVVVVSILKISITEVRHACGKFQ